MRGHTELSASDRRRVLLHGQTEPIVEQRLKELESRISELEKRPPIHEVLAYLIKRIQRIEKHLKLGKFDMKNPLENFTEWNKRR